MADAGFKLTVEGEKEFRKAISDVNAILKLNQAELQRVTAEYNASDKSMEAMTERQQELGGVIERQTAVVEQMEGELSRLTDEYGENATGVVKMQAETEKARATLANLNAQFQANQKELEAASQASEEYGMSVEEIEAQLREAEAEIKAMDAAMQGNTGSMGIFGRTAEDTEKRVEALKKQNEKLNEEVIIQEKYIYALNEELDKSVRLYGDGTVEADGYKGKIQETRTEIDLLKGKIQENNTEIENAKDPATDLKDVFSQISDITGVKIPDGLTAVVGGIGDVTAAAGLAVTAVAGITKEVADAAKEAQTFASEIRKLSNQSGLTTTQVEELQYVSDMLGVEYESVADTMKDLTEKMYDASTGNAELSAEFNDLGVSIYDTKGELRESFDVLIDLIDAYGDISNKTERAARMQKILGESSRELNALIYAGGEAIKQYREQAHETAYVMDKDVAAAMEVAAQKTRELDAAWDAFKRNLGAEAKIEWGALFQGDLESALGLKVNYINGVPNFTKVDTPWYQATKTSWDHFVELLMQQITGNYFGYEASVPKEEYNITVNANIKEFEDLLRITRNQRVAERMK